MEKALEDWRSKECQGRIARIKVDQKASHSHLSNLKLSDSLVSFIVKARLQLSECNSLLHTYYPAAYPRSCNRCGFPWDTISHVLNNCRASKGAIKARHNRMLKIITTAVSDIHGDTDQTAILKDQLVKPCYFDHTQALPAFEGVLHTRPDLCVINHSERSCLLIEVAVPFDPFLNDCYQNKFDKYLPLCQRIQDMGYSCKIIVLIVGSLGNVHPRFVSGLSLSGLPNVRAKSIARYCSISAMIGSKIIWKQRCKAVLP